MTLLWMVMIGFVVGLVARALMPGSDPVGVLITIVLGVAGSLVAGYLGQTLGLYQPGEPVGFLASVMGAMLLLFAYRITVRGRTSGI